MKNIKELAWELVEANPESLTAHDIDEIWIATLLFSGDGGIGRVALDTLQKIKTILESQFGETTDVSQLFYDSANKHSKSIADEFIKLTKERYQEGQLATLGTREIMEKMKCLEQVFGEDKSLPVALIQNWKSFLRRNPDIEDCMDEMTDWFSAAEARAQSCFLRMKQGTMEKPKKRAP